jgi:U3 small nucleolar RNA-associated protein 10
MTSAMVQVLMVTRSETAAVRLAAVEAVHALATALKEEFLQLLPETLPFLSELMEDSDRAVEARTHDVIKLLERLSEEDLGEYLRP